MDLREIYFAAGCFWGTEKLFQSIHGVIKTQCGFANGKPEIENPSYQRVCQGDTDCREAVHVLYDPSQVSRPQLLKAYFHVVDPTLRNRQGNDIGTQYQTGIYYIEKDSEEIIKDYALQESKKHPVFAVEICPLNRFFPAEEYHQNYLTKNPNGYCHIPGTVFDSINNLIR